MPPPILLFQTNLLLEEVSCLVTQSQADKVDSIRHCSWQIYGIYTSNLHKKKPKRFNFKFKKEEEGSKENKYDLYKALTMLSRKQKM